jgi:hypothetical protein
MSRFNRNRKQRRPVPEGHKANELAKEYGKGWWLFKKGLLILSAIASIVGIAFWFVFMSKVAIVYIVVGIIVGLLMLYISLWAVSKFRVSILRAVFIPVITAIYLAFTILYLNR